MELAAMSSSFASRNPSLNIASVMLIVGWIPTVISQKSDSFRSALLHAARQLRARPNDSRF
jgi:hypothetical protein